MECDAHGASHGAWHQVGPCAAQLLARQGAQLYVLAKREVADLASLHHLYNAPRVGVATIGIEQG